mmetsp:Transcript_25833/g.83462  ORF Transcript_25833/g.83462 Transcript_25833/m.83462 type:complete len:233 (-) Transcript_25833:189-887(-)
MRRVDELCGDAERDGMLEGAPQVLAPEIAFAGASVAKGSNVNALDEDEPAAALVQHVVADARSPLVPVCPRVVHCPRRLVRFVHQVGRHHVPPVTQRLRQPTPAILRGRLVESPVLLVPEAGAGPVSGREPLAGKHHQNVVLGGGIHHCLQHLQVPDRRAGVRVAQLRVEHRIEGPCRNEAIRPDSLVVEWQPQGIEMVLCEEIEVEVHWRLVEALRDTDVLLCTKPHCALE